MDAKSKRNAKLAICRDVIANLHITCVKRGTYYDITEARGGFGDWIESSDIIQKQDVKKMRKCGVCAKGALLMSRIDKFNKLAFADMSYYYPNETCCTHLSDFFSKQELDQIEAAFEGWGGKTCSQWAIDHPMPKHRLLAIMQNIIDHGKFRPKVRYDVK